MLSSTATPRLTGGDPITITSSGIFGDQLHSDREFCVLPSLVERAQLNALFLRKLADRKISGI